MDTLAILVAAGRGERMGAGRPKGFLEVAGQTLLLRSVRALAAAPSVDAIVAVVPAEHVEDASAILRAADKVAAVVAGGGRRQDSVLEGMKPAPDGFDGIVLVHDAARPFVSPSLIESVVAEARNSGAAVPVVPVADTIKKVKDGRIAATLDRSELAAAQTPQGFRFSLLVRAYEDAFRHQITVTDEASAVERLGLPVAIVPGEATNRKLTTPDDLVWAEAFATAHREPA
jgi:2-C-methyl-D-erythritol 4-phosphate cytidylyltransferase